MSQNDRLSTLLSMEPSSVETITFGEYLSRLAENPKENAWMAQTAASMIVRAIEQKGELKIEAVPEERRPYLSMLKQFGIPSWKAFDRVRGSQRTVHKILTHLRAAAQGGYQLRLALILVGGPGSGKGFLVDALKDAIEGQAVWTIKGCPVYENPINLLTLLPPERVAEIGQVLGCSDLLDDLLATAGKPCQHCWEIAVGARKFTDEQGNKIDVNDEDGKPNLMKVPVELVRVSSRKFGSASWSPSADGCPLHSALRRGSRGVVDMPELFSIVEAAPGTAQEVEILLEATSDRRIPSVGSCDKDAHGYLPLDAVLIGQTNPGDWQAFIKNQRDPGKFNRRFHFQSVPYILSVTEEALVYEDFIKGIQETPHIDPMVLKMMALVAVCSRIRREHELDVVTRARMYDGEGLVVEKKDKPSSPSSSPVFGGMASNHAAQVKARQFWSVEELWLQDARDIAEGKPGEGEYGLNMSYMLTALSHLIGEARKGKYKYLSVLRMLDFMRSKLSYWKTQPGLASEEQKVLKQVEEFLRAPVDHKSSPGLIEMEYRRVLKRELISAVAPDYEARASEEFELYRKHATAWAKGEKIIDKLTLRKTDPNMEVLEGLEKHMKFSRQSEVEDYRRQLSVEILDAYERLRKECEEERAENEQNCSKEPGGEDTASAAAINIKFTWRDVSRVRDGIIAKLNEDIAKKVNTILTDQDHALSEKDRQCRDESIKRFQELGYSEHSLEEVLQYIKENELWK